MLLRGSRTPAKEPSLPLTPVPLHRTLTPGRAQRLLRPLPSLLPPAQGFWLSQHGLQPRPQNPASSKAREHLEESLPPVLDASLTAEPRCPSHFRGVVSSVKAAPTQHRGEKALGPRNELTQDSEKVSRTSQGTRGRATHALPAQKQSATREAGGPAQAPQETPRETGTCPRRPVPE